MIVVSESQLSPSPMLDTFTYNDRVVRNFVIACVVWGIVGLLAGVLSPCNWPVWVRLGAPLA